MAERTPKALLTQPSTDPNIRYWQLSLACGLAVIGVVAALLETLARTAEQIEGGVADIWRVGKLIANNTVHIPLLVRTNQIVADIIRTADGIARAATRIHHAVTGDTQDEETN